MDFYPVAYSGNGEISGKTLSIGYGIVKEDGSYNDYQGKDLAGKIAVLNVSSPDGVHPHSAYAAYHSVNQRLKLAKAKGAAAVLLINPEKTASDVPEFFKAINSIDIPVLFVRNEAAAEKLAKKSQKVSLAVSMKERYSTGYNLAGFVNNNKARTVVLGAHYDHIGMGGENSCTKVPQPSTTGGRQRFGHHAFARSDPLLRQASGHQLQLRHPFLQRRRKWPHRLEILH